VDDFLRNVPPYPLPNKEAVKEYDSKCQHGYTAAAMRRYTLSQSRTAAAKEKIGRPAGTAGLNFLEVRQKPL